MTISILAATLMALAVGSADGVAPDDTTVVLQGVTVSGLSFPYRPARL